MDRKAGALMGWYGALDRLEAIDRREPGALEELREYLKGEADAIRTMRTAAHEFIEKHGRRPRYLPAAWRAARY